MYAGTRFLYSLPLDIHDEALNELCTLPHELSPASVCSHTHPEIVARSSEEYEWSHRPMQ